MFTVPIPLQDALAIAARLQGEPAERMADHVLAAHPTNAEALHIKAIAAAAQGRDEQAAALLERAIAHGLEQPQYYRNICAIYERLGRLEDAITAGRRAVALDATDAESYHNLTVAHARRLELDTAIAYARTALSLDPTRAGAHLALAEALLMRGDFAEGWREYEWRFRLPGVSPPLPATDRPQWDGSPMQNDTLLLVADQGFGDVIQFCRYIEWVRTRARNIVIACATEMQPLVRQVAGGIRLFAKWNECPPYAAYAALSGLPRLHGTVLDNIPASPAYLQADRARAAAWGELIRRRVTRRHRTIGLVWAGRSSHSNDRNRSMQLGQLGALFDLPATTFVVLQKGPPLAQAGRYFGRAPLLNLAADIEDFIDTASILANLDLVVTVDTSVGHLAAAMGRPTWILLPYAPDWRWLLSRTDSPWYPSVRLFRQPAPGDWQSVVRDLTSRLAAQPESA